MIEKGAVLSSEITNVLKEIKSILDSTDSVC